MAEPYRFEPERVGCEYAIAWHGRYGSDATLNNVLKHGDYRKTGKTKKKLNFMCINLCTRKSQEKLLFHVEYKRRKMRSLKNVQIRN